MYVVNEQTIIGTPDVIRQIKVTFNIVINNTTFPFERTVIYKYNDRVKGEVYNPFDVVPDVTTSFLESVVIFNGDKTKTIGVKIKSGKDNIKGNLVLELPKNWEVLPKSIPFEITKKGETQTVTFQITAPNNPEEITAKSIATIDGVKFYTDQKNINYEHISKQQILSPAEAKFVKLDLKIEPKKVILEFSGKFLIFTISTLPF